MTFQICFDSAKINSLVGTVYCDIGELVKSNNCPIKQLFNITYYSPPMDIVRL